MGWGGRWEPFCLEIKKGGTVRDDGENSGVGEERTERREKDRQAQGRK